MKVIILAAGYGTRLGELGQNLPKALLPVGNKPIIEHLLVKLSEIPNNKHYLVITNAKFFTAFSNWEADFKSRQNGHFSLQIFSDASTCNENRLGAIGDLNFLLNQIDLQEDVLISAGDNLFQFDVRDYFHFYQQKQTDCICTLAIDDPAKLRRTGVVQVNAEDQVIGFEEKPVQPKSTFACPPLYFLQAETLKLIPEYLAAGNNPDAPGHLIQWLFPRRPIFAYRITGTRYDVGDLKTYQNVNQIYSQAAQ